MTKKENDLPKRETITPCDTVKSRFTEDELKRWADRQKQNYALGKLDQEKIRKLESIPGWNWKL